MAADPVLTDVRAALESEREELRAQMAGLGDGATAGDHYDANFADSSQVTAERGEAEALLTSLKETLDSVEHALEKVDGGSYGVCESCGEPITPARLEAMPAARLCISCASKR
ncbi:MAG: TraR/DksA family transcriptional regulator [Acidimicrobiales bacterium]